VIYDYVYDLILSPGVFFSKFDNLRAHTRTSARTLILVAVFRWNACISRNSPLSDKPDVWLQLKAGLFGLYNGSSAPSTTLPFHTIVHHAVLCISCLRPLLLRTTSLI
jgi:hypothetical protein